VRVVYLHPYFNCFDALEAAVGTEES